MANYWSLTVPGSSQSIQNNELLYGKIWKHFPNEMGLLECRRRCRLQPHQETLHQLWLRLSTSSFRLYSFQSRPSWWLLNLLSTLGSQNINCRFKISFAGLTLSNGPLWHEQRRFAMRQLRDLGVGKSSIESHIHREVELFCQVLKETNGKSIDPMVHINFATTNIIWAIVSGKYLKI